MVALSPPRNVPLLRADPHNWGLGLVHQIDVERDQTMCGKSPGGCPGTKFYGLADKITCKACLKSIAARERHVAMQARAQADWARLEQERQESRQEWQRRYQAYLQSPVWRDKRARVLKRANGLCEGCGEHRAAEVHHLRYPQGCWPGSDEWISQEKLFDLRAICPGCHGDVHAARSR
jgi:5-methylcytosine-specific restriction endonuclease McrA